MVLDEAEEVHQKKKERRAVGSFPFCFVVLLMTFFCFLFFFFVPGRILLKGDNVTLVQSVPRVDTGAMN